MRANEEILNVSSSGGAFSILADYVFDKGGYVVGASFDADFKGVSHIMISDKKDMHKLRGSKYVYSKTNNIYEEIKKKLESNKYVLFSGTPCQAAALKSVLDKSYEKLIVVDLLCGGVPSEKIFRQYMNETTNGRKVKSVSFRPKKYGWDLSGIEIIFEDGTSHMIHSVKDPYFKGYLNSLFVSKACADCQFTPPPRQGDFTIGDFWNISRFSNKLDYRDGVSCLLVNNEKAETIYKEICGKFSMTKNVPISFLKRFNRLQRIRPHHLARPRFFDLIHRGFSIDKSVDYCLNWKFDIALTGCWTVENYGGELTYFALYKVLQDMGYTTIMVERRLESSNNDIPVPALFKKNPYSFYDISKVHKNFNEQRELNNRVFNFIIGSDQIWNYRLFKEESILSYSLDYVSDWRKRISYATSFGSTRFVGSDTQKKVFHKIIKQFQHISVREKSGVSICKNEFKADATWVLDPIFLCGKEHYNKLLSSAGCCVNGSYVFTYFMHPDNNKIGIDLFACKLGYGLINTINASIEMLKQENFIPELWPYPYEENCKLEDWLFYIVHSKFVITDSFHAVCLAIIYQKPFLFIKGRMTDDYGFERISTILETFDLMDRVADTVQSALESEHYFEEINYSGIQKDIEKYRISSLKWLSDAIKEDI